MIGSTNDNIVIAWIGWTNDTTAIAWIIETQSTSGSPEERLGIATQLRGRLKYLDLEPIAPQRLPSIMTLSRDKTKS